MKGCIVSTFYYPLLELEEYKEWDQKESLSV